MKKIVFIISVTISFFAYQAAGQSVSIATEHTSGTCSDYTVSFDGTASAVATSFNFNGGTLPTGWSTSPYTISSTTCSGQNSPDNSAYFWATSLQSGGTYDNKRFVQTKAVNVSGGGNISFYIRYGNNEGKGCEQPDEPAEEVVLYYSIDGGSSWTIIYDEWNTTSSGSYAWYNWHLYNEPIPAGAHTSSTIFRWYQPSNSGSSYDNWGLEDVSIGTNVTPTSYKWFVNGSQVATTEDLTYTFPSAATYTVRYDVLFSDGGTRSATTTYQVLSNQAPFLNSISNIIVPMNSGQQSVSLSGIADGDCVSQVLSLSTASANTVVIPMPTYSYSSPNTTGVLYFTPAPNQVGNVPLTATITDNAANAYGSALSVVRNFNVYVNDYPTNPGAFTLPSGDKLNIDYLYNIAWGASTDQTAGVTYQLEYLLNGGTWVSISSANAANSYNNWGGHQNIALVGRTVQFRVRSYDGTYYSGYTTSPIYNITENEPPVAVSDTYLRFYTETGKEFSVNAAEGVLSNDTDPDNDTPLYVGDPRTNSVLPHGILTLNSNGSFTYTPADGYIGSDQFTYYANDGQENSNSAATVTITICTPAFNVAGTDDLFSNPVNWNCGYVPNEPLNIVIRGSQHMSVNQNYTCKTLKFEAGASFNCQVPSVLNISDNVLNRVGNVAIRVNSLLKVSSSLKISQPKFHVQHRLDFGEMPYEIFQSDQTLLDSLYGKTYQGGLIFYFNTIDGAGMVATSFNQGNEVKWGCGGTDIPGANGSVIGTGAQNTIDIEAGCTVVGRAADICANLTSGGYSDWFLPSKDELNAMYQNLHLKGYGNFSTTKYYWSSTEKDHSGASAQSFLSGQINDISKDSNYLRVRAVREF